MLIVGFSIGWGIASFITWYKTPAWHRMLPKAFVFGVDPKFTDYFLAVNELGDLNFTLHKKGLSPEKRTKIQKQLPEVNNHIKQTNHALNNILKEAIAHYGRAVNPVIHEFILWKDSVNVNKIPYDKMYVWANKFMRMRQKVYNELRKASGYYNIDSARDALVMQLVLKAEAALKERPNNPQLCTVMKYFNTKKDPDTVSKIIAFVDIGNQYCDQYYHKRSAWGITKTADYHVKKPENQYENLPYDIYYQHFVLPLVPEAMKQFKNKKENMLVCDQQGIWPGPRDPKQGALRVAYRGEGKTYCPALTPLEKKNYLKTSYVCILLNSFV